MQERNASPLRSPHAASPLLAVPRRRGEDVTCVHVTRLTEENHGVSTDEVPPCCADEGSGS